MLKIFACGAVAQMGERLNGIQEAGGSIPPSSTKKDNITVQGFKGEPLNP